MGNGKGDLRLAALALVVYLLLFASVRRGKTDPLDLALAVRLQQVRAPWFALAMASVSWLGFPPQSRLVPPLLAVMHWAGGRRLDALFQLAAWGTAPLAAIVKTQMRRQRPPSATVHLARGPLEGSSFPSGHVLGYLGVYGFLAYLAANSCLPRWARRLSVTALGGLLALVGPSRIYLGHHWPTDTLASYLLGFSYLLGLTCVYRRALAHGEER